MLLTLLSPRTGTATIRPVDPGYGGNAAHARANHIRRMQEIDEQDVEDITMMVSLFRSMGRG
jgi:hypothetical protein